MVILMTSFMSDSIVTVLVGVVPDWSRWQDWPGRRRHRLINLLWLHLNLFLDAVLIG